MDNDESLKKLKKIGGEGRQPPNTRTKIIKEEVFRCCCCGVEYPQRKNNFLKTTSVLYRGNDGYFPICRRCMEDFYAKYLETTGDAYTALRIICRQWDIYINDAIFNRVAKSAYDNSKVAKLVQYSSLAPHKGKCYDDVVLEDIAKKDLYSQNAHKQDFEITPEMKARWGNDRKDSEYEALESHYDSFIDQITEGDIVQEKLLIDLSEMHLAQKESLKTKDYDSFGKMSTLYQNTLKNANFKPIQKASEIKTSEKPYSSMLQEIEEFCPADVYKDGKLFDDVDSIKDYWQRFIVRPLKNFFLGTSEQDPEFSVGAGDSDDKD